MTMLKLMSAAVVLLGLSACGSSGPQALYGLTAPVSVNTSASAKNVQVLVAAPMALQALDTSSIAVAEEGRIYSYYPKVAWADTLPNVFQAKLIETLENTGKLRGVGRPGQGLLIDYQLQTTIRSFEMNINGGTRAYVEVAARVVNDRNGVSKASRLFRAEVPTSSTDLDEAVDAMNVAADQVMAEIAAWTLKVI
ncbi:ABC transporter [Rhodobacteraceae bacterium RKSG542]|uniref:ABC-type transport auxiliary lipoprotein family protein n=1 Tax=Pseudovibrio flavus TaxID=2529854 RepID=UPI0012BD78A8|nr:ABC-type transport auxiliary lipoprotein family protein [Pseudovibrio flavus]MTI19240.1 ABC transporter [Pseudovibrio flavus]